MYKFLCFERDDDANDLKVVSFLPYFEIILLNRRFPGTSFCDEGQGERMRFKCELERTGIVRIFLRESEFRYRRIIGP